MGYLSIEAQEKIIDLAMGFGDGTLKEKIMAVIKEDNLPDNIDAHYGSMREVKTLLALAAILRERDKA
jgi:hypothetical protein